MMLDNRVHNMPHSKLANGSLANGNQAVFGKDSDIGDSPHNSQEILQQRLSRAAEVIRRDPQLQAVMVDPQAMQRVTQGSTCIEIMANMFREYAQRIAFGYCPPGDNKFVTLTYGQTWERVQAIVAGWAAENMVKPGEFVGISGFSSVDWIASDIATTYAGGVVVPLPTNILADDVIAIMNEAETVVLMISALELTALAPVIRGCTTLRNIVVMDSSSDEAAASGAFAEMQANLPSGCKLTTMDALLAAGRRSGHVPNMVVPGQDGHPSDPLTHLMYTSGSSGRPKGAEYHEHLLFQFLKGCNEDRHKTCSTAHPQNPYPTNAPQLPVVSLGFLPLNHLMGRMTLSKAMLTGGQTFFTRSPDMSAFFEDLRSVRPTEGMFPPRLINMLHDHFQEQLARLPAPQSDVARQQQYQDLIRHFREVELGGRLFSASYGSAPTSPEVVAWFEEVLGFPPVNGYGSTEGGMIMLDNKIQRHHVTDFKLVDVPELGYTTQDKPYPRGELRVKTKRLISGYYKHPEATADLFDSEGFLKTGDVVEQLAPDTFVWIDRVKNIIKLAQGEYVSVSRLEEIYVGNSSKIRQMYIYGNSLRSYLVAVVVPIIENGAVADPAQLKAKLRLEIDNVARSKALQGYEIPREFVVEMRPFSKENHLLTDSNKPARGQLKKRYQQDMEALYTALEERQKERLRAMKEGREGSVAERVKQALEVTLGLDDSDMAGVEGRSFGQLGGDSLAAIQFARYVSELCGVNLPVSFVLDHSHSLQAIIDRVSSLVSGEGATGITFEIIHGSDGHLIKAADLKLDRFLSDTDRAAAAAAVPAAQLPPEPIVALLTGANSFLGRFLLLELLQRVSNKRNGRVVAIVRGNSDEQARERLRAGFDSGDPDLLKTFDSLSAEHLTVFAGDLAKLQLGLSDAVWQQLAEQVDTIVHNGALVNHAYSYEQLFEPNVLGTLELMRLAIAQHKKALAFVSSVGVLAGIDHGGRPVLESEDGPSLAQEHLGDGGYAMGYGCSKWACEVLLKQLHEEYGVPVKIFRCGMILAHTRYLGQINTTDFFTRLLCGIAYTGIAPESFYALPHGAEEHFDGMPIDFVAGVIATTAAAERAGMDTYHVVNPHRRDGVSLDRIVDWVQSAGYKVRRVAPYEEWYSQFKAALERLEPVQQQRTPLPIIYQWEKPQSGVAGNKFDARELRKRAAQYTQWRDVPHLDEAFIHQNMRHLNTLGLVTPACKS